MINQDCTLCEKYIDTIWGFLQSCDVKKKKNLWFVRVNMRVLFLEHQDSADGEK